MSLSGRDIDLIMGEPWRRDIPPTCPDCGCNLSRTGGNCCPECGKIHLRKDIERLAGEVQEEIRRLKYMNDNVRMGVKFGVAGIVALMIGLLRAEHTPSLDNFGRFVAIVCGFFTMALGANVFRVKRLPAWAGEFLPQRPDFGLGVTTALAGVLLIILSVFIR